MRFFYFFLPKWAFYTQTLRHKGQDTYTFFKEQAGRPKHPPGRPAAKKHGKAQENPEPHDLPILVFLGLYLHGINGAKKRILESIAGL